MLLQVVADGGSERAVLPEDRVEGKGFDRLSVVRVVEGSIGQFCFRVGQQNASEVLYLEGIGPLFEAVGDLLEITLEHE